MLSHFFWERRKIPNGRTVTLEIDHTGGHWRAKVVAVDGWLYAGRKITPPNRTYGQLNALLLEGGFTK